MRRAVLAVALLVTLSGLLAPAVAGGIIPRPRAAPGDNSSRNATFTGLPQPTQPYVSCPCPNPTQCVPMSNFPKRQVFVFAVSPDNYPHYDWKTPITTVAVPQNAFTSGLMCVAHSHGARVVYLVDFPTNQLTNATARTEWVSQWLQTVQDTFTDGINVDFEDEIAIGSPERDGLTALVQELSQRFHAVMPNCQITVDVAWSPDCIDGRCYDYGAVAAASNFVFAMGYDEQSQIFPPRDCLAYANDPIANMQTAIARWTDHVGVPTNKLVWGVPWYGYQYACVDAPDARTCPITPVPFRNASCSDAAGTQHDFQEIMRWLNTSSTTGRQWDDEAQAPWFDMADPNTGQQMQVWYDDPESLGIRYAYARSEGLLGVGMWEADSLYYGIEEPARQQTREMWHALKKFIDG